MPRGGLNRITSKFCKNWAVDQGSDDPTLWAGWPRGIGSPWKLARITQHATTEWKSMCKTCNCRIYMNQKVRIYTNDHLQPKIWQATIQIERSIQNKLLGLEKWMKSNKARDKRFNLKFTPTKRATSLMLAKFPPRCMRAFNVIFSTV
jgi:hypothetical protein